MRGTFANVRIKNLMMPPRPTARARRAAVTLMQPSGEKRFIYDAAMKPTGRRRHADGGLRRRGIRHRLQPRLGRQGHAAAGHPGRWSRELRAHPPQPTWSAWACCLSAARSGPGRRCALTIRRADGAARDAFAAHRHADRGGLLQARRHPAVRAEAAAGGLSLRSSCGGRREGRGRAGVLRPDAQRATTAPCPPSSIPLSACHARATANGACAVPNPGPTTAVALQACLQWFGVAVVPAGAGPISWSPRPWQARDGVDESTVAALGGRPAMPPQAPHRPHAARTPSTSSIFQRFCVSVNSATKIAPATPPTTSAPSGVHQVGAGAHATRPASGPL